VPRDTDRGPYLLRQTLGRAFVISTLKGGPHCGPTASLKPCPDAGLAPTHFASSRTSCRVLSSLINFERHNIAAS
jgi:hypothetical protein